MDSHTDLAIEASGLVKTFGENRAVDGVELAVRTGMVYGLLGPNGAGKTTTIRMLATLLRPDAGTARVFGHDVVREADEVRSRVSLTGQFASVDEDLTGFENLVLLARLLGYSRAQARARAGELLEAFGLSEAADRLAVIDHGKVIAEGTSGELKASVGSGILHVRLRDPQDRAEAERVLSQVLGVPVQLGSDPAALSARVSDPERVAQALAELSRSGAAVTDFALGQPSLDEVFLALTGRPTEDDDATEEDAA